MNVLVLTARSWTLALFGFEGTGAALLKFSPFSSTHGRNVSAFLNTAVWHINGGGMDASAASGLMHAFTLDVLSRRFGRETWP